MSLFTKISILFIVLLACTVAYLYKTNLDLKEENADQAVTIKSMDNGIQQYKNKFGEVYTRSMNQVRTAKEVAASKDSTIAALRTKLFAADIKLKDVVTIGATTTRIVRDTSIVYATVARDTVYNLSEPPHIYEYITIKGNTLSRKLDIRDSIYTISHLKKEFVEPRKKFFLARWFQARQNVLYTDKLHSNPFITTTSSIDITVLDKHGNPLKTR